MSEKHGDAGRPAAEIDKKKLERFHQLQEEFEEIFDLLTNAESSNIQTSRDLSKIGYKTAKKVEESAEPERVGTLSDFLKGNGKALRGVAYEHGAQAVIDETRIQDIKDRRKDEKSKNF